MKPETNHEKHFCAGCERLIPKRHMYCVSCKAERDKQEKEFQLSLHEEKRCGPCAQLAGTYRACPACPDKQEERRAAVRRYQQQIKDSPYWP